MESYNINTINFTLPNLSYHSLHHYVLMKMSAMTFLRGGLKKNMLEVIQHFIITTHGVQLGSIFLMFIMLSLSCSDLSSSNEAVYISSILRCLFSMNIWQCLTVAPVYSSRPITASFLI